jgi:hypothetical protein
MKKEKIDRLLRSAVKAGEEAQPSMPLGFDTRVVALWSGSRRTPRANGVLSLIRRVALVSLIVIVGSTIAVVREARQNRDITESFSNEFAIADTAIQDEFSQ